MGSAPDSSAPGSSPGSPPASSRPFALRSLPEDEFLLLTSAAAIGLASGLNGKDTALLADFVDAIATSIDVLASVRLYHEGISPPIIAPPEVIGAAPSTTGTPGRHGQGRRR